MSKFKPCVLTPDQKQAAEIARIGFMSSSPFYSHFFMAECREVATLDIPTAATDGRTIYYNPEYLASLKPAEAVFVLAHEMAHVVNRHPQRMKSYERDGKVGSKPFDVDQFNTACLAADTPVLMADGTDRMIRDIRPGDMLASPFGPSKVIALACNGIKPTVNVEMNGRNLRCTVDHKFATEIGFVNAEDASRSPRNGFAIDATRSGSVHPSQLYDDVVDAAVARNEGAVCQYFAVPGAPQTQGQSLRLEASKLTSLPLDERHGHGLHGGLGGRRGDNIVSTGRPSPAAFPDHNQHLMDNASMGGGSWILCERSEEQAGARVFQVLHDGVRTRDGADSLVAVSRRQAVARADIAVGHPSAEAAAIAWAIAGGGSELPQGAPFVKHARLQVRDGAGIVEPVYDVITEAGVFFAAGMLTHNCDYVINAGLMDEGVGMMNASWLYDPNTSGDDLPENVYQRIYKQPPPPNPNQGQGKGPCPPKGKTYGESPKAPKGSKVDKTAATQGGAFDTLLEPSVDAVTGQEDLPDESEFKEAIARAAAAAKAVGKMPASLQRLVDSILEPQVDWKEHVRMLMTGHIGSRKETWERPNRRRLALNPIIITPGRRGHGADTVVMVIDNSGSISEKELSAAFAEIGAVLADVRPKRVILIWCDARVQQVDEASSLDELDTIRVKGSPGSGGTSFIPPFDWLAEHEIQPETLVYITDGYGSFPNEPAPFPVVWAVTTAQPVPWGDVVRIKL